MHCLRPASCLRLRPNLEICGERHADLLCCLVLRDVGLWSQEILQGTGDLRCTVSVSSVAPYRKTWATPDDRPSAAGTSMIHSG
jgi:hypothetical protein